YFGDNSGLSYGGNLTRIVANAGRYFSPPCPSPSPTATATASSTATNTPTPTNTPTATATPTATGSPTCTPASFTNSSAITIPDTGAANPYPSSISVSGSGIVTKLTVTISGVNHTFSGDLDFLLVGPGGQNAIIWSDAGGSNALNNVTVT